MLKSSQIVEMPARADGRNPFYLGAFEGTRLRRVRSMRRLALVIAAASAGVVAFASVMAVDAFVRAAGEPACRVVVTDADGDAYVAGAGDTIADAMAGMTMPDDWQAVIWEGCER